MFSALEIVGFCLAQRLGTESQEKLLKAAKWVPWMAVDPVEMTNTG